MHTHVNRTRTHTRTCTHARTFYPSPGYLGGALYSATVVYSQLSNYMMIETAISLNAEHFKRAGTKLIFTSNYTLRLGSAISVVIMIVGAVLLWWKMKPDYYRTFYSSENFTEYLTHRWDFHNTPVIGTGRDAVRADVLT